MNFTDINNEDLYQMCLRGDEPAWGYVYSYVLAIARSPKWRLRESPEDLAQGIVCHLLTKGLESVEKQGAFRSFIRRVAVNFILDSFKKTRIAVESIDASDKNGRRKYPEPVDLNPGPDEIALGNALSIAFKKALNRLSPKCREVLEAYADYKMGLYNNYKELAQKFGKTIGTLSSRIKRCLDELRQVKEIKDWLNNL